MLHQPSLTEHCCFFSLKVIKHEGLSKDMSECTLFDLLKYNDIDDDEHLTKEEFYTAFGEYDYLFPMQQIKNKKNCEKKTEHNVTFYHHKNTDHIWQTKILFIVPSSTLSNYSWCVLLKMLKPIRSWVWNIGLEVSKSFLSVLSCLFELLAMQKKQQNPWHRETLLSQIFSFIHACPNILLSIIFFIIVCFKYWYYLQGAKKRFIFFPFLGFLYIWGKICCVSCQSLFFRIDCLMPNECCWSEIVWSVDGDQ